MKFWTGLNFFQVRIMTGFCDDAHGSSWSVRRKCLIHWVTISCSRKICTMELEVVYVLWTVLPLHACSVAVLEKQCPAHPASTAGSMEESCCCGCTGQPMALWLQFGLAHQWTCATLGRHNSWSCAGFAVSTVPLSILLQSILCSSIIL